MFKAKTTTSDNTRFIPVCYHFNNFGNKLNQIFQTWNFCYFHFFKTNHCDTLWLIQNEPSVNKKIRPMSTMSRSSGVEPGLVIICFSFKYEIWEHLKVCGCGEL